MIAATKDPRAELAQRTLMRRSLLAFTEATTTDYIPGWVHEDMCRRLEEFFEAVERRESPRLMLFMPPRTGKSRAAAVCGPAWALGHHPTWEFITASYGDKLAKKHSRDCRDIVHGKTFRRCFPDVFPDTKRTSTEEWGVTAGGGVVAAGVDTGITGRGANCFPDGTLVSTPSGPVPIESMHVGMKAFTRDPETGRLCTSTVLATQVKHADHLVRIGTAAGRSVLATPEHRFHVPGVGWREARHLAPGDPLSALDGADSLRSLRSHARTEPLHVREGSQEGPHGDVLFEPLLVDAAERQDSSRMEVHGLRKAGPAHAQVVPQSLQAERKAAGREGMPPLRSDVPAEVLAHHALHESMRKRGPLAADAREGQFALQDGNVLLDVVPQNAPDRHGEGRRLRGLSNPPKPDRPPHRRATGAKRAGEPRDALQDTPRGAPQVVEDAVAVVERLRRPGVRVHDIQIEGTRNFFAGQLCAHNCLIIDDPVKNRKEADSAGIRDDAWDWYTSTARTRMAPGGGILVIQTRWHTDDLAGRLLRQAQELKEMGRKARQWKVVSYEAIAERDERYRRKGEALHPERFSIEDLEELRDTLPPRDWLALYQQKPTGDDGSYFRRADIQYYDRKELNNAALQHYQAWDLAVGEEEQDDFTVGVDVAVDTEGHLIAVDIVRGKWGTDGMVENIIDFAERWQPMSVGIESGQISMSIGPWLSHRVRERGARLPLEELKHGGRDKFMRARSLQGAVQHGRMLFPKDDPDWQNCIGEMIRFGGGGMMHDDQVDAMSWIGLMTDEIIVDIARKRRKTEKPKGGTVADRLNEMFRSKGRRSAMAA